jgi:hypothetical protein
VRQARSKSSRHASVAPCAPTPVADRATPAPHVSPAAQASSLHSPCAIAPLARACCAPFRLDPCAAPGRLLRRLFGPLCSAPVGCLHAASLRCPNPVGTAGEHPGLRITSPSSANGSGSCLALRRAPLRPGHAPAPDISLPCRSNTCPGFPVAPMPGQVFDRQGKNRATPRPVDRKPKPPACQPSLSSHCIELDADATRSGWQTGGWKNICLTSGRPCSALGLRLAPPP